MAFVALDRRFVVWADGDEGAPPRLAYREYFDSGTTWEALRTHRRVVVLAEAGSGKTEEMRQQARALTAARQFAFFAALEDVATNGLDDALSAERERLQSWRDSALPAYFFIDSVDEAKLEGIPLERALRKLADGVRLAMRRAHIVLSGRVSDWEFRADLKKFHELLPVPADPDLPPPPSGRTLLVSVLRGQSRRRDSASASSAETPIVVLMQPFDDARVRRFAHGQGVADSGAFIDAIEREDLWSLARRPLDLEWMVSHWQRHGRFGSLAYMLEMSLNERMQEHNAQHRLNDPIPQEKMRSALERVGAALSFGRVDKVAIPDSQIDLSSAPQGLRLQDVLPDWSPEHLRRLRSRAVFDPSTLGYMRLHNDNEGTVRAYLNAQWLFHRRAGGAPIRRILALLFSDTYGFALIRPSMRPTAAWLALRDPDVARQVIAREPGLLIAEADPGSLSFPVRAAVLRRILMQMAEHDERFTFVLDEPLRRFATVEWGSSIRELWNEFHAVSGCRILLLRIIALGPSNNCTDLVESVAVDANADDIDRILACRALAATGSLAELQRYAVYIRDNAPRLSSRFLWEAIDALFGRGLTVEDFLTIVPGMSPKERNATSGLDHVGPRLLERISKRTDLENFVVGINRFAEEAELEEEGEPGSGRAVHQSLLLAAARSLMKHVASGDAPPVVLEIAFRVSVAERHYPTSEPLRELRADLTATPQRRRTAFWYVKEKSVGHRLLYGNPVDSAWSMSIFGWNPQLQLEDIDWLLNDTATRSAPGDMALAVFAAMEVWQAHGKSEAVLDRIQKVAAGHSALGAVINRFLVPRVLPPEELAHQEQLSRVDVEREERESAQQAGWRAFLDQLRQYPDQLRNLPAPSRETIDTRLYYLWELLSASDGQPRYAIEDVRLIEPILGPALTDAFRDGLIAFWRQWEPTLESARPVGQRNLISKIDCMGICSVTVEAASNPRWPKNLTAEEASKAARYATLELNGFPSWITRLAIEWPHEVSDVLLHEVVIELDTAIEGPHASILQDIEHGDIEVAQTVAPALFQQLQQRENLTLPSLERSLATLSRGLPGDANGFVAFLLSHVSSAQAVELVALFLAAAFYRVPEMACQALVEKLGSLQANMQRELCETLFSQLFGGFYRDTDRARLRIPLPVLESLVHIAFQHIRVDEDLTHEDGKVFSPGIRDSAQSARSALIRLMKDTPGQATVAALRRLKDNPAIPIGDVEHWCLERAAADSENTPWSADEPYALEQTFDVAPRTAIELQTVALGRIDDIEHDLLHGDSALADIFKALPDENAVQRWVSQELQQRAGRAYTREREPVVANESEPDIRLQSRATDATLPIEIKVAHSWTLAQLEKGLVKQLGGRYLRLRGKKAGVYLIAHQKRRARGWRGPTGRLIGFDKVIAHLRDVARTLAESHTDAPQIQVSVIDVSGV